MDKKIFEHAMNAAFTPIPSQCMGINFWKHKALKNIYAFTPNIGVNGKTAPQSISFVRCDKPEELNRPAFNHFSVTFKYSDVAELITLIHALEG